MMNKIFVQRVLACALLAGSVVSLTACFPLVMGGAVMGGMVATDRRTSGTVLEDEGIELRAKSRIRENLGDRVHINVVSYNRLLLLTGEVPTAQDKQLVEQVVSRVDNVSRIENDLAVLGNSTLGQRSSDALVTGRVKAALVDSKDLFANAFKIITERGTTYMMGRVTQREAKRATEVVSAVPGVQKVVRLLEIISEDELARLVPPAPKEPVDKANKAKSEY
jgi:osmotically-inducible protein OsmY